MTWNTAVRKTLQYSKTAVLTWEKPNVWKRGDHGVVVGSDHIGVELAGLFPDIVRPDNAMQCKEIGTEAARFMVSLI